MSRGSPGPSSRRTTVAERTSSRSCSTSPASAREGDLFDKIMGGGHWSRPVAQRARRLRLHLQQLLRGRRDLSVRLFARRLYGAQRRRPDRICRPDRQARSRSFHELWNGYKLATRTARTTRVRNFEKRKKARDQVHRRVGHGRIARHSGGTSTVRFSRSSTNSTTPASARMSSNAFHALALDEKRKNFLPTLWQQDAGRERPTDRCSSRSGSRACIPMSAAAIGSTACPTFTLAWMASEVDRRYLASTSTTQDRGATCATIGALGAASRIPPKGTNGKRSAKRDANAVRGRKQAQVPSRAFIQASRNASRARARSGAGCPMPARRSRASTVAT